MHSPMCMWDRGTKKEVIFTSSLNLLCRGPSLCHGRNNKFRCDITAPVRWVCQNQSQNWMMKPDTSLSWVWFGCCIQCTVKYNVLKPEQRNDPSLYSILSNGSMDSEWWTGNDTNEPFGSSCVVYLDICRKWLRISSIYASVHPLSKNLEATSNCRCPTGDIQFHSEDQHLLGATVQKFKSPDDQAHGICASLYVFSNNAVSSTHYTASNVKIK
jgi:hypothetical protein